MYNLHHLDSCDDNQQYHLTHNIIIIHIHIYLHVVSMFTIIHPNLISSTLDSMGCNVLIGYILSQTESSQNIINGLEYLEFNLKGSTLICDEAPAFLVVTQHFEMNCILCNHHYWNKVSRVSK